MIQWDDIKKDYLSGMKPKEIAEKYNINYKTLTGRITREGWKKTQNKIVERMGEKIADLEAIAIQQMREQEREHTDILVKSILTKLIRDGEINPELNAQDVKSLTGAYKDVQQIKYKSFGISDKLDIGHKIDKDIDFEIVD